MWVGGHRGGVCYHGWALCCRFCLYRCRPPRRPGREKLSCPASARHCPWLSLWPGVPCTHRPPASLPPLLQTSRLCGSLPAAALRAPSGTSEHTERAAAAVLPRHVGPPHAAVAAARPAPLLPCLCPYTAPVRPCLLFWTLQPSPPPNHQPKFIAHFICLSAGAAASWPCSPRFLPQTVSSCRVA